MNETDEVAVTIYEATVTLDYSVALAIIAWLLSFIAGVVNFMIGTESSWYFKVNRGQSQRLSSKYLLNYSFRDVLTAYI